MNKNQSTFISILFLLLLIVTGCSDTASPLAPTHDIITSPDPHLGHSLLGAYTIEIDTSSMTAAISPDRAASKHYNITTLILTTCPECVAVQLIGFDPVTRIYSLNIGLQNPTSVSAYAVKGIIILDGTAEYDLENPDAYTNLWTTFISPFRYFAKTSPDLMFAPAAIHTEPYEIFISAEHHPMFYIPYAIDASRPGIQKDPLYIYNIETHIAASTATISCDVLDPQNDTEGVWADTTAITGGAIGLTDTGPNHWEGSFDISAATPGTYDILLIAKSAGNDNNLYHYAELVIEPVTYGILEGSVFDAVTFLKAGSTKLTVTPLEPDGDTPDPIVIPSTGEYSLPLKSGHYNIEVKTHQATVTFDTMTTLYSVTIGADKTTVVDFGLGPSYLSDITGQLCCINGMVTDSLTGLPIQNAQLSISGGSQTGGVFQNRVTDERGHYIFWKVPCKDASNQPIAQFTITCVKSGYLPKQRIDIPYAWNKNTPSENFEM